MSAEEEFKANMQDIFFDYDAYDVRADAQATCRRTHPIWRAIRIFEVVIGGYCDERGSNEYNLALGQNRADAAKNALVTAGVAANRIRVVSYGKEKPFCTESTKHAGSKIAAPASRWTNRSTEGAGQNLRAASIQALMPPSV